MRPPPPPAGPGRPSPGRGAATAQPRRACAAPARARPALTAAQRERGRRAPSAHAQSGLAGARAGRELVDVTRACEGAGRREQSQEFGMMPGFPNTVQNITILLHTEGLAFMQSLSP